jgi:hypothetical protein
MAVAFWAFWLAVHIPSALGMSPSIHWLSMRALRLDFQQMVTLDRPQVHAPQ